MRQNGDKRRITVNIRGGEMVTPKNNANVELFSMFALFMLVRPARLELATTPSEGVVLSN